MKLAFATIAVSVAATLTACQTVVPSQKSPVVEASKVILDTELKNILAAHTWSYQPENSQKPIVLSFNPQGIYIDTGCNGAFGAVDIKGNTLSLTPSNLASTMKLCSPDLMAQEKFAVGLFAQPVQISIDQTKPTQPVMTLKTAKGQSYQFIGTQTPETKYQSQAETIFLEVSPELKDCTGMVPQKCLQVREIKYSDQGLKTSVGEWELFYDKIEGYEHNPNLRTVLRLKRFTIARPAADQSKYAYVHDMTIEQEIIR